MEQICQIICTVLIYGIPYFLLKKIIRVFKKIIYEGKSSKNHKVNQLRHSTIYSHPIYKNGLRKKNVLKPAAVDITEAISADEFQQWLLENGYIKLKNKEN